MIFDVVPVFEVVEFGEVVEVLVGGVVSSFWDGLFGLGLFLFWLFWLLGFWFILVFREWFVCHLVMVVASCWWFF